MPFRAHYAKKEAREHTIAQNALAAGDLKEWHKHEAKAHRAGSHARGNGLMHTDYLMLGKENMAPPMGGPVTPVPVGVPVGVPMETPIITTTQSTYMNMMPTSMSAPIMPAIEVASPMAPMGMGYEMYGSQIMAPNTIYEGGMATLEPTIIMEAGIVEEPQTIIEYGEPIPAMIDGGMMQTGMMPMVNSATMMPAVMSTGGMMQTMSSTAFTETQYLPTQFMGENVMMM